MKHIPTKRGGNYSHTMRNGTDVYNFSYYDITEVNKIIIDLKQQNAELKEQSSRLAAEAVRQAQQNADLCVKNAELLNVIKWANNHGGLGYSIHGEFEKAIAKESK